MANVKVKEIINLIPVHVKCEIDGKSETIKGYIDYNTNSMLFEDARFAAEWKDVKADIEKGIVDYINAYQASVQAQLSVPDEAYDQWGKAGSYKYEDVMDPELNVILKQQRGTENGKNES